MSHWTEYRWNETMALYNSHKPNEYWLDLCCPIVSKRLANFMITWVD